MSSNIAAKMMIFLSESARHPSVAPIAICVDE
jgi:hypothetical protein